MGSTPRALIHGEFYASNVLVRTDGAQQICAIDWEMTAVGPGVVDLAALTSGNWSEDDRRSVEEAYTDGLPERLRREPSEFAIDLACARLHLAVQWLGWAPGWSPPVEHAQDWLRIAQSAAAELAL